MLHRSDDGLKKKTEETFSEAFNFQGSKASSIGRAMMEEEGLSSRGYGDG